MLQVENKDEAAFAEPRFCCRMIASKLAAR